MFNACKESSEPKKTQDAALKFVQEVMVMASFGKALCFPNPKIVSDIGSGHAAETLPSKSLNSYSAI
jgi:hypothetical protein